MKVVVSLITRESDERQKYLPPVLCVYKHLYLPTYIKQIVTVGKYIRCGVPGGWTRQGHSEESPTWGVIEICTFNLGHHWGVTSDGSRKSFVTVALIPV